MTFLELAQRVLDEHIQPLTPIALWEQAKRLGYDSQLGSTGKTPWATLAAQLYVSVKDNAKSPFDVVPTRPKRFFLKKHRQQIDLAAFENADPDEEVRTAKPPPSLPVSADADDFDPGPRQLKYIGFRQMAGLSRVFVRMDGKARYRQYREGDTFILELVDSSVPVKNNTRPLDTSYFNGPVSRVQAVPSGDNTRVEVKLRESVPFTVKRIGTTIAVDFSHAQ